LSIKIGVLPSKEFKYDRKARVLFSGH
jgi:hypothetical protein